MKLAILALLLAGPLAVAGETPMQDEAAAQQRAAVPQPRATQPNVQVKRRSDNAPPPPLAEPYRTPSKEEVAPVHAGPDPLDQVTRPR